MWFELAIVSMLAYGVQDFLFKLAEVRNLDFRTVLSAYPLTVLLISLAHYLLFPVPVPFLLPLALFAFIQVMFFIAMTVLKLEALDNIPSLVAFPIFALNGVGAAVLAALFLSAPLGPLQLLGVALSAAALLLLVERGRKRLLPKGVVFALAGLACYSVSNFFVAAAHGLIVPSVFIALSSIFAVGPYYLLESHIHRRHGRFSQSSGFGIAVGVVNAIAFFALLYALELGHSTIVFPLVGMSLLVSIALSKMAFHERLGARRALAILIAVVAIVLIRANT